MYKICVSHFFECECSSSVNMHRQCCVFVSVCERDKWCSHFRQPWQLGIKKNLNNSASMSETSAWVSRDTLVQTQSKLNFQVLLHLNISVTQGASIVLQSNGLVTRWKKQCNCIPTSPICVPAVQSVLMWPVSNKWIFNIHFRQSHKGREGGQRDAGMQTEQILWRIGEWGS